MRITTLPSTTEITTIPTSSTVAALRYHPIQDEIDDVSDDCGHPTPRVANKPTTTTAGDEYSSNVSTSHEDVFLFPTVFGEEDDDDVEQTCVDDISDVCAEDIIHQSDDDDAAIDEEDGATAVYASYDSALPRSAALDDVDEVVVVATAGVRVFDEIRASLDACTEHPYLDLSEQRAILQQHFTDMRSHFVCAASDSINYSSVDDRNASAKILVHEAHRLQHARLVHKLRSGYPSPMDVDACSLMWKRIGNSVSRDLLVEDHTFVQRRLSCMCIFNPSKDERQYSDNDLDRMKRISRQEQVLEQLSQQARRGGNPFFVEVHHPSSDNNDDSMTSSDGHPTIFAL